MVKHRLSNGALESAPYRQPGKAALRIVTSRERVVTSLEHVVTFKRRITSEPTMM